MRIRSLGWAGIEIAAESSRVVIDAVADYGQLTRFVGPPHTPLLPPSGPVDVALVTHLHTDHTDATTIATHLTDAGRLLRPAPAFGSGLEIAGTAAAEAALAELQVRSQVVEPWEVVRHGSVITTAVPAVDGFGDPQVSWVVEAGGVRIFHGGDTTFHGYWWQIAMRYGPFDAAFLPVNGAVCAYPHRQPPSPLPAVLDPTQATVAASILGAKVTVPIHYDCIHAPGVYEQVDEPAARFVAAAAERGVPTTVLGPGEVLDLAPTHTEAPRVAQ